MIFYDVVSSQNEAIAEIVEFDDGACVLKFYIFKKIHCFDNIFKLMKYMETLRILDYKVIVNGVQDEDEEDEEYEEDAFSDNESDI